MSSYYKITYEKNTKKLTDEIHRERIKKAYDGNVIALSDYVNNRTIIKYKCLKHDLEWDGRPNFVMAGQTSCPKCVSEIHAKGSRDTLDSLKEKIAKKWGNEYEVVDTEYIDGNHKMTFRHNLPDGRSHTLYSYPSRVLSTKSGCPVCAGVQVSKGFNDIATTDPEIASWFENIEDTFKHTRASNTKIDFRCPKCKHVTSKYLNLVTRDRDIRCPICNDGISYPNKFIFNVLLQIKDKLDFLEREYRADWCRFIFKGSERKGIYDIYFGINGKQYIIEMDGAFHYGAKGFDDSLSDEDIRFIDSEKTRLALKNGVQIIRIDCNYGNCDKYEYIKLNLINSDLSKIISFDLIDFNDANIRSQKSLMVEACRMWDEGCTPGQIIDELHISQTMVPKYLRDGEKYGLCHNYSPHESNIRAEAKKIICINTKEIFRTILEAQAYYDVTGIGDCCRGKTYSAGKHKETGEKLFWMFYDDYEKND